ncbi:MAG: DUF4194 domain-containing protein [Campylobacterota bacterium]|nr:DUF4194 domain-containing protein [Campylobacterota bacterium]
MNIDARLAIIALLKGLVYKNENEKIWSELIDGSFGAIQDYFVVMGLDVILDDVEGYAYLQNRVYEDGETTLPKLIRSRELSYKVSLLAVLLRKRIVDFDMQNENTKAVVTLDDIREQIILFLPKTNNEIKLIKEIDTTVKKVEELGFLRKLKNQTDSYEIKRSIKTFVDAQWLNDFNKRLQEYKDAEY